MTATQHFRKRSLDVLLADLPYYAGRYMINRVRKLFSKEKRLAFWGPIYPGMMQDLKKYSLLEVCARQWKACVETANDDLAEINTVRVYRLKYEDFVRHPEEAMKDIMHFLGLDVTTAQLENSVRYVSPRSIHNYKKHIQGEELSRLNAVVEPVMNDIYDKIT